MLSKTSTEGSIFKCQCSFESSKGPHIKYVGGSAEGFCGCHEKC